MADPLAATLTQLHNFQSRTGKTLAELDAVVAASGLAKHAEKRALLMDRFKLGYGDTNAVVLMLGKALPALEGLAQAAAPAAGDDDPLDAIYAGPKAHLRPLHDAELQMIGSFGAFESAAKKSYVSLRRNKQFATLGPATKDTIEIGLNAKHLMPHARLMLLAPGGMCQATTRIGSLHELEGALNAWLKQAYDAAG